MIITPETKKECCDESRLTRYIRKIHSQSINSLKDEIINLKDKVIKKLQDENARMKVKCEKRKELLYLNQIIMIWLSMADAII